MHALFPLHSYQLSTNTLSAIPNSKSIHGELIPTTTMSATKWIVATSVGAVEALKDQGFCRWNHVLRSVHHKARNSVIASISQAKKQYAQSASAIAPLSNGRSLETEDSLRQVMLLSSWVPN